MILRHNKPANKFTVNPTRPVDWVQTEEAVQKGTIEVLYMFMDGIINNKGLVKHHAADIADVKVSICPSYHNNAITETIDIAPRKMHSGAGFLESNYCGKGFIMRRIGAEGMYTLETKGEIAHMAMDAYCFFTLKEVDLKEYLRQQREKVKPLQH